MALTQSGVYQDGRKETIVCDDAVKLLTEWRDYYWRRYLKCYKLSASWEHQIRASAFDMAAEIVKGHRDVNVCRKSEIDERLSEFKDYKYGQFPDEWNVPVMD